MMPDKMFVIARKFLQLILEKGEKLEADYVTRIGQLPTREILLGQVMGGMVAPLRAFMWILKERSRKLDEQK